jgi:anti-anti-sigma regulatory factor
LLRLTIGDHSDRTVLRLEGRLIGPWSSLVERCWRETTERTAKRVVVDLTAVTFVDDAGKALLAEMHDSGTLLQARGPLIGYIVDQIRASALLANSLPGTPF